MSGYRRMTTAQTRSPGASEFPPPPSLPIPLHSRRVPLPLPTFQDGFVDCSGRSATVSASSDLSGCEDLTFFSFLALNTRREVHNLKLDEISPVKMFL